MNDGKESSKSTFSQIVNFFRNSLKRDGLLEEEKWLKSVLVDSKVQERYQPQVLQGMWQAYGQMRSARTRGRYAVFATGVIGVGLLAYRVVLDEKNKELKESQAKFKEKVEEAELQKTQIKLQQKALDEREKYLADDENKYSNLLDAYKDINAQLQSIDTFVLNVCKDNGSCLSEYKSLRGNIEEVIVKENNEKREAGMRNKF